MDTEVKTEPKRLDEVLKLLRAAKLRRDRRVADANAAYEGVVVWALTLPLYVDDDGEQVRCRPSRAEAAKAVGQHRSNLGHITKRRGVQTSDNWRGKVRRG